MEEQMAMEILDIESDLPYRFDYTLKYPPQIDDFDLFTFEQVWSSTALGFGGIGGQAITSATTYVFIPKSTESKCFVYFAGKFAYSVKYSRKFMEDVIANNVASVGASAKYSIASHNDDMNVKTNGEQEQ